MYLHGINLCHTIYVSNISVCFANSVCDKIVLKSSCACTGAIDIFLNIQPKVNALLNPVSHTIIPTSLIDTCDKVIKRDTLQSEQI